MARVRIMEGETEAPNCPCRLAGHGPGAPRPPPLPLHRATPTATRQPYLAQVPGSRGGQRTGRARGAGSLRWTAPSRAGPGRGGGCGAAGAERSGQRAAQREGADWAPPAGEQTGFHRRPAPRPSPLPSAGPLPLPSLGVGRCAWHIPHILPPVSSARPPLPSPAPRACWRNQGRGSPRRAQSKLQKALPRWKASRQIPAGLRPSAGRSPPHEGRRLPIAPLPAPDALWPPLGANDFHRCCGLILLRTTVPRSILQMKIPDRGGEGGRGARG